MLEQGSPFSDQSAYILVAAGPQDVRAIALYRRYAKRVCALLMLKRLRLPREQARLRPAW